PRREDAAPVLFGAPGPAPRSRRGRQPLSDLPEADGPAEEPRERRVSAAGPRCDGDVGHKSLVTVEEQGAVLEKRCGAPELRAAGHLLAADQHLPARGRREAGA